MPRIHRALRRRRLAQTAPFWLAAVFFTAGSTRIGYQDIASLMAQQPQVTERARARLITSTFGTIQAALFTLPQPVGTTIPALDPTRVARFDASGNPSGANRLTKGDLQVPRIQIQILGELLKEDAEGPENDDAQNLAASLDFQPFARLDPSMLNDANDHARPETPAMAKDGDGETDTAVYFDPKPAMAELAGIEPWAEGEAPEFTSPPPVIAAALPAGPAVAEALEPKPTEPKSTEPKPSVVALPDPAALARALKSPADRLNLNAKTRPKAEKCLANAIYFEARSEPVRGQIAVAQVIVNRAFSGYYPEDICGVVYQNAHRHLSCQFTFACDGIPDVVTEPEHWARAQRIATAALDGKIWLGDVGLATHYHASYVYPYWVRSMRKLKKIGLHTFYRPRKWGEDNAPTWDASAAAELVAKM